MTRVGLGALAALVVACTPATFYLDDAPEAEEQPSDTASDTDTDTDPPLPVAYDGPMWMRFMWEWNDEDYDVGCEGAFSLVVEADGSLHGSGTCAFDDDDWDDVEGELVGEVDDDGAVSATFSYDLAYETYDLDASGIADERRTELELRYESAWVRVDGEIDGEASAGR